MRKCSHPIVTHSVNRSRFSVSPLQKKHQTISVNNSHWSKNQVIKEKQKVKKRKQKFLQNPEKKKKARKKETVKTLQNSVNRASTAPPCSAEATGLTPSITFLQPPTGPNFTTIQRWRRSQRKPDLTIAFKEEEISSKDGCWGEEPMVNTNGSRVWMGVWLGRCERKGFGTMMPLAKEREKWAFIVGPNTSSTIGPSNEYFNGFFFFYFNN